MNEHLFDKVHRINCLTSEMDAVYHQAALKLHVSDSVMYVLYMIHDKGEGCLLHDICKATGISKQTVNSAIRKLERDGILYLRQHSGRSKKVCLTDKGKLYIKQTSARLFEAECGAFEDWDEDEINQYLHLMEKYTLSFRRQVENL